MKKISWVTHTNYDIPLPENHKFTASKFSDLYNELKISDFYHRANILSPEKASVEDVSICHDLDYVLKIKNGTLSDKEIRRLGFKWSETLSNRSFLAVNGTLLTCKEAIKNGIANHLAGGTHHSHRDFGSGYCVFNDLAYASLHLIRTYQVKKILIFDTDVHQGDGTAWIFQNDPTVFTFSMHCSVNFPSRKQISDLDVPLPVGMDDECYLQTLAEYLPDLLSQVKPDLVLYDGGVDTHIHDTLGKLALTNTGIFRREMQVLSTCLGKGYPVASVIGGGYTKDMNSLVYTHSLLHRAARDVFYQYRL